MNKPIKNTKPLLLITGVTSGVGLSLTNHFAGKYHVLALGRNEKKLHELFAGNDDVTSIQTDLSDRKACEYVFQTISEKYGYIPYLINNAGVNRKVEIKDITYDQLLEFIHVNALAPMIAMQRLLPLMKEHNFGRIINITSGAPLNCFPGFALYSSSKGALNAITVTTAKEYTDYNIKINLMSPGPVKSNMAPNATMEPSVCHPTVEHLLSLDENGPTGKFFWLGYEIPIFPDLEGIEWLRGKADSTKYAKVVI